MSGHQPTTRDYSLLWLECCRDYRFGTGDADRYRRFASELVALVQMKLPHRRQFLHLTAAAAVLPALSRIARAQAYPMRPVHLIVPFGPAGATDITARFIGQWLSERLGQQFIVENRPGAGGNIGTEAVVRGSQTAIRSSMSLQRTRAMRRFTTSSISISSAISHRSHPSSAFPISWL